VNSIALGQKTKMRIRKSLRTTMFRRGGAGAAKAATIKHKATQRSQVKGTGIPSPETAGYEYA
jgi:hypothetical protein